MAKKKKPEEHENLERYLVSYSDFITLLFATFVVLYALAQADVAEFSKLEEAIRSAFSISSSVMDGQQSIMDGQMSNSAEDSMSANSVVEALMLEYISVKYEQDSYENIKAELDEAQKNSAAKDYDVSIDSRGLVIRIPNSDVLFPPGQAKLTPKAQKILDEIGIAIGKRFMMHLIRVDGYTDNSPISNPIYPSNWELSTARSCSIVRYFINKFKFLPDLFTAAGYGETRAITDNKTAKAREMNRRVEIVVLRNKFKKNENYSDQFLKMDKDKQEKIRQDQLEIIGRLQGVEKAVKQLEDAAKGPDEPENEVIKLDNKYNKESERLENFNPEIIEPIIKKENFIKTQKEKAEEEMATPEPKLETEAEAKK